MREIELIAGIGFVGAEHREIIEVEDDVTDNELWEMAEEFGQQYLECYWEEVK